MTFLREPRAIAIYALLVTLAPLGCSSSLGDFDENVCVSGGAYDKDLDLNASADYVAVRTQAFDDFSDEPQAISVVSSFGAPCAKASDKGACQAALSATSLTPALRTYSALTAGGYDVVFTRGDEVGHVGTHAELVALLGTIDTATEAALVAFADGKDLACDEADATFANGRFELLGTRGYGCGEGDDIFHYQIFVTPEGEVTEGESELFEKAEPNCAIGRRPVGLVARRPRSATVAGYFANAAHLEAASVPAFRKLAAELRAHGAPRDLVRASLASAEDEIRHARVVSKLARRYGATPTRPVVRRTPTRSLVEIAIDNATEGCVRETYGAAVATLQSRRAADPVVRRALAAIARDEARHAALSWTIDAWAAARLGRGDRARVEEARRGEIEALRRAVAGAPSRETERLAGVPGVALAGDTFAALERALWGAVA